MKEANEEFTLSGGDKREDSVWGGLREIYNDLAGIQAKTEKLQQRVGEEIVGYASSVVNDVKQDGRSFGDFVSNRWEQAKDDFRQTNPFCDEAYKPPKPRRQYEQAKTEPEAAHNYEEAPRRIPRGAKREYEVIKAAPTGAEEEGETVAYRNPRTRSFNGRKPEAGKPEVGKQEAEKPEISSGKPGKTTHDVHGRVDSITYANGKSNRFEYDQSGKLARVKSSDGTSWVHEEGLWFKYDKNRLRTDHFDGKMYVTNYGEIVQKNDIYTHVTHRDGSLDGVRISGDGSRTTIHSDRSEITTEKGRVIRLKYPDGKLSDFEYDKKGQLSAIKNSDGTSWGRQDGNWTKKDGNGKALERFEGCFSVDLNGDLVQRKGDSIVKTTHRNGKVDGSNPRR